MTKLYLMRHGQTYFNLWHKIQGWVDSPLTETGIKQAQATGAFFKENGINFDHAFCSTAERASDTLELVTDHQLSYQRLKGLREEGFGQFEAQDERLNPPAPYNDFFVKFGGEDQKDVAQRMYDTISQIMQAHEADQNILIVSHAGAMFNFFRYLNLDVKAIMKQGFHNCSVAEFDYQNGKFKLVKIMNPAENIQ